MAKLRPQAEQKQNASLSMFDGAEKIHKKQMSLFPEGLQKECTGEWIEENARMAECGRWSHYTNVKMQWFDRDEKGEIITDGEGRIIWSEKEFKGECVSCGAKKRL